MTTDPAAVQGTDVDGREAILERIASGAPIEGTLDEIVLQVESQLPGALGSILLLNGNQLHGTSVGRLPATYNAAIEGIEIGPNVASCGSAAWRCEPVYVSSIENDPLWADYREVARLHGLGACWSVPIRSRRRSAQQRVLGTFAVYFATPRTIDPRGEAVLLQAEKLACIALEAEWTTRALRNEESRFRAFVDHSLDGFFLHDVRTAAIVEVNRQACESLGYTRDELIGRMPRDIDPDVTAESLGEIVARVESGGAAIFESRHRRKDGTTFPVEVRANRVQTGDGAYNMALVRDLTERRKLEEQLAQARRMEAIGRLAGGIAHDFNNLLTVVQMSTDLLLAQIPDDSPLRADVVATREAGVRATALTAQLLAFSRRSIVAARPLDLNAIVERLATMLERVIGENIQLTTHLTPGLSHIVADASQVEQVLMNLVVNARDAMPRGGALRISTALVAAGTETLGGPPRPRQTTIALSVADSGVGMTAETRQRLFEPYFTTKGPGRGLGLATVYGIVKQSGGDVHVESATPGGTTVTVTWMATQARPSEPPPESEPAKSNAEVVLLVEDEHEVRRLLARGIGMKGYEVLTAASAEEALELERNFTRIDIVVTDVVMPNQGGRELVDALRLRRPAIRVLFISGYTDDAIVRLGVSTAGARDAFLQKPFTLETLLRKLREILDARTA